MRRSDIVVIGGGSAGIAVAASIKARNGNAQITLIDPAREHFYQPGWTMVGGGIFDKDVTRRPMASVIPDGVDWLQTAVTAFDPDNNCVQLADDSHLEYGQLIVAPGLKIDWDAIPGLSEALGRNGVTSNYRFDLAPYTWELAQKTQNGRALFTQPPMPIKCAGAPQKAMYLTCSEMEKRGSLAGNQIAFHNAGPALFGVAAYVPALMTYIERYGIDLNFSSRLSRVRGDEQIAEFTQTDGDGNQTVVEEAFDMLHVCPPQCPPDFIQQSPLANDAGWVEVDPETLRHARYDNIHGLGDVISAPNAKTAAAARMQAPVVAHNVLAAMGHAQGTAVYNGYGSCPLTVERGKIVLAEFGYGGTLLPSFPAWLIDGTQPSRLAWFLKERLLPPVYWHLMLKGREWLTKPTLR
ncbi:FAD-dependent oxidoreductase [Litorivicinus lipolyticus]|uniref:NAD(P)/FAD-dependent oxidoreductase n=1 Tax=Litorivicinus lipolyticus TaxID=418701 RepID=UPI003B5C70F5